MLRQPAVADQFYPGDPAELRAALTRMTPRAPVPEKVLGIVAPHAGYVYSGSVAGMVYGRIQVPATVIMLGPNHHGAGARAALYPAGSWQTPLGAVTVNQALADLVVKHAPLVERDATAHRFEHSLEVQVPFLQHLRNDVTIVPLCLGFSDLASCERLGQGLAAAIKEFGDEVLLVASSDMSHYESAAHALEKDQLAINELLALNPAGLHQVCRRQGISMCGVIPATVLIYASQRLGASHSELVRYATSGDVNGDYRQVVGYAAFTIS
jgi:MEMO1 family protein